MRLSNGHPTHIEQVECHRVGRLTCTVRDHRPLFQFHRQEHLESFSVFVEPELGYFFLAKNRLYGMYVEHVCFTRNGHGLAKNRGHGIHREIHHGTSRHARDLVHDLGNLYQGRWSAWASP